MPINSWNIHFETKSGLDLASEVLLQENDKDILACLDIGSNAIRLSLGKFKKDKLVILNRVRIPLRFGADVFSSNLITDETLKTAIHVFQMISLFLTQHNICKFKAIATSAFRDAKNSKEVLEQIKSQTSVVIDIIDGNKEAELIFKAVFDNLKILDVPSLLIDIGGGSTEISYFDGKILKQSKSFNIGTVRYLKSPADLELQKNEINNFLQNNLPPTREVLIIGTGGNLRRLGKLRKSFLGKANQSKFKMKELPYIMERLTHYTIDDRIKKLGMRKDRAEVIEPALKIFQSITENINSQIVLLPNVGLGDGALLDLK